MAKGRDLTGLCKDQGPRVRSIGSDADEPVQMHRQLSALSGGIGVASSAVLQWQRVDMTDSLGPARLDDFGFRSPVRARLPA